MFKKKVKTLLVPYILFFLLGTLIALLFSELKFSNWIADLYYGNPEHIFVSSTWFLVALFFVNIAFALILKIKNKTVQYFVVALLATVGIVFGELYTKRIIHFRLPLDLDVVPVSLFFFALGYYTKSTLNLYIDKFKVSNLLLQVIVFMASSFFFTVVVILNKRVNMHGITYQNPIFYFIESLLGIAVTINISVWIEKLKIKKSILWIGQNTIYILGIQAIGTRIIVKLINLASGETYPLYGLPYKWAAVAFIGTLVFSITFTIIIKSLFKSIKRKVLVFHV